MVTRKGFKPGRVISNGLKAFVLVMLSAPGSGTARTEDGSLAQRRACKPDVFRLCAEFIPNRTAITNCLQHNKPRLNPDCRAVFDGRLKYDPFCDVSSLFLFDRIAREIQGAGMYRVADEVG